MAHLEPTTMINPMITLAPEDSPLLTSEFILKSVDVFVFEGIDHYSKVPKPGDRYRPFKKIEILEKRQIKQGGINYVLIIRINYSPDDKFYCLGQLYRQNNENPFVSRTRALERMLGVFPDLDEWLLWNEI